MIRICENEDIFSTLLEEMVRGIGCQYKCKNMCDGDQGCLSECFEECSNSRSKNKLSFTTLEEM